jgi:hypothetical protein
MVELKVKTLAGADSVLDEDVVDTFRKSLRGALLRPQDGGYDQARMAGTG